MAHTYLLDQPVGPVLYLQGQQKRFFLPKGVEPLLDEMTREILKHNPPNIYEFLADFCDEQVRKRSVAGAGGRRHSWEWRKWSTDGSSLLDDDELKQFIAQFHVPIEAAEHLATVIQSVYRGFMARKDYRHLILEKKRRRESLWEEWIHQGKFFADGSDIQEILLHYGVTLAKANDCATKIQAMFRGYLARKSLDHAPILAMHLEELGITEEEANKQAAKIQQFYRNQKAKKELKLKAEQLIEEHIHDNEEEDDDEVDVKFLKKVSRLKSLEESGEEEEEEEEEEEYEVEQDEFDGEYEDMPPDDDFLRIDEDDNQVIDVDQSQVPPAQETSNTLDYEEGEE